MDRINIRCLIGGKELDLQLNKKAMPGEAGPCYMITGDGCFKGYIARQKNGSFQSIGTPHYTADDLMTIGEHLGKQVI